MTNRETLRSLADTIAGLPDGQPSWAWRNQLIAAVLDIQERENADRPDWKPAIDREMVEGALNALLGIYDCRSSDFAAAYAWIGLWETLGVDHLKLTFVPATPPSPSPDMDKDMIDG